MLDFAERGDASVVDMLVRDIYGGECKNKNEIMIDKLFFFLFFSPFFSLFSFSSSSSSSFLHLFVVNIFKCSCVNASV